MKRKKIIHNTTDEEKIFSELRKKTTKSKKAG
jgi:hypothetical protein